MICSVEPWDSPITFDRSSTAAAYGCRGQRWEGPGSTYFFKVEDVCSIGAIRATLIHKRRRWASADDEEDGYSFEPRSYEKIQNIICML